MNLKCEDCRFWEFHVTYKGDKESGIKEYTIGYCKRYPEETTQNNLDWCGEWKAK